MSLPEYERSHYAWVAAILLAGDIQARVVANPKLTGVAVTLVTGEQLIWSNQNEYDHWAYSMVNSKGEVEGKVTLLESYQPPEVVAKFIATYDFPSPAAYPVTAINS